MGGILGVGLHGSQQIDGEYLGSSDTCDSPLQQLSCKGTALNQWMQLLSVNSGPAVIAAATPAPQQCTPTKPHRFWGACDCGTDSTQASHHAVAV